MGEAIAKIMTIKHDKRWMKVNLIISEQIISREAPPFRVSQTAYV